MGDYTLEPLLEHIRSVLPPQLYSVLVSFVSHSITLVYSFSALVLPLISTKPWEWDTQTILPPLISVLTAYLALVSLYRTTTWMIRTSWWFIKWGTTLALLIAGVGWIVGTVNSIGFPQTGNTAYTFGGVLLDAMNSIGGSRDRSSSRSQTFRSRTKASSRVRSKPKPWESFERHREWEQQQQQGNGDALKVVEDIVGAAGQALKDSSWWEAVVDGSSGDSDNADLFGRKTKMASAKGKSSRSR
jgi:hypothetical protein